MEWHFTMRQTQSNNIAPLFQFIIVVISIGTLGACQTTSEYDTSEALGSEVSAKASGRISERYSIFFDQGNHFKRLLSKKIMTTQSLYETSA